jgi:isopenicillin N synthase-like dioxygenase
MPGVKEFWQMRNGAANPFGETSRKFFNLCSSMGERIMGALARGLFIDPSKFVDELLDSHDAPLSSTIFRFFHYYNTGPQCGCQVHTDIGVVTLIPASSFAALEVMDFESFEWYNFEQPLHPNDVMVLCGETLERLSAYYYRAVVHRVTPLPQERYSLVFLMRARPVRKGGIILIVLSKL